MKRTFLVPILGVLTLAIAAPACAQVMRPDTRYGSSVDVRRVAYDRGYREGVIEGERDGRNREPFSYQNERDFQRATIGYHRSYGDPERYRLNFRAGFADGYDQGYRRYARGNYGRDSYGRDSRYGGYSQGRAVPLGAYDIGARDGFEKGRDDASNRRRADARSHKWYREGDRDYNNRYGSRDQYKNEYRRGFLAGYDRGYGQR
ncbi:hypothetical protein BH24ACI5_BH24ACI5_21160 [soil metagenome]